MRHALLIVLALVATSATAAAGDDDGASPEARRLVARAQVHYDLGEYDRAIAAYRDAYRIQPSPGLLYNLGQAYRMAGDCVSATTMYRNYLRLAPRSPYRSLVKQHLSSLAECNRRRTGGAVADTSLIGASTGGASIASLGIGPFPYNMPREETSRAGERKKKIGYALGGVGVALTGVAVYYAFEADEAAEEVSQLYEREAPWRKIAEADARGQRAERLGIGFAVAGGVAIASGLTMYVLGRRAEERSTSLLVAPEPKGASVSVSWGF